MAGVCWIKNKKKKQVPGILVKKLTSCFTGNTVGPQLIYRGLTVSHLHAHTHFTHNIK